MQGLGAESQSLARGSILVDLSRQEGRRRLGGNPSFIEESAGPSPGEQGHLHKNMGTLGLVWEHLRCQTDHLCPAPGLGGPW